MELITQNLRERSQNDGVTSERIIAALARVGDIWESRLAPNSDWTPPDGSPFPWAQVRISLAGLVPGLKAAGEWRELGVGCSPLGVRKCVGVNLIPAVDPMPNTQLPRVAALILVRQYAAHVLVSAVRLSSGEDTSAFMKMSRDETLWPRLVC